MSQQQGGDPQSTPPDPVDRALEGLRHDVSQLADALGRVAGTVGDLSGRVDTLRSTVQSMHESRPDITSSLQTIVGLLDRLETQGADTRSSLERLAEQLAVRTDSPPDNTRPDVERLATLLDEVSSRLGASAADSAHTRDRIEAFLGAVGELRHELAAADEGDEGDVALVLDRIDQVGQQLGRVGQQQAERLDRLSTQLAHHAATSDTVEQALLSIRADFVERLERLHRQLDDQRATGEAGLQVLRSEHAARAGELRDELADLVPMLDQLSEQVGAVAEADAGRGDRDVVMGAVTAATAGISQQLDGVVAALADRLDVVATMFGRDIDDVRQRVEGLRDVPDFDWGPAHDELRRAVLADLRATVEPLRGDLQHAASSADAAREELRAALDAALDALRSQVARAGEDAATVRERIGQDVETLRSDLHQAMTDAVARAGERSALTEASLQSELSSLRDTLAAAIERMLNRVDADANRILDAVASNEGNLQDQLRRVDGGLVGLRRDLEQVGRVAETVDAVKAAVSRPTGADRVAAALADLRRDVQSTREELVAVGRAVGTVGAELRQGDGGVGGAAAALLASAAAAMARLETRLDHEFDAVGRQVESLGTLVHSAVEAIDSLEARIGPEGGLAGATPAPVGERLRATASGVLESLRSAGRDRAARRGRGSGPRSLNP